MLTPTQVAQLTLSLGASNDTDQIDRVFKRLEEGNALENVDEFLTQLTTNGRVGYSWHHGKEDNFGLLSEPITYSDINLNLYVSCSGRIHIKHFVTSFLAYCMIALQHVNCVVFKSSHDVI